MFNFEMAYEIAQSDGESNCCYTIRREALHPAVTAADKEIASNTSKHEEKSQETGGASAMASCATYNKENGLSEVRRARRRRHRRGKNLHRHRLSKHRRDQRARNLQRVIGAPRNDNEFLMSQYNEGLHLQREQISDGSQGETPSRYHHVGLVCQSSPSAVRQEDDLSCPPFSPRSSPDGSVSSGSGMSDYSSLPSSPDEESRYHSCRELFPAVLHSQPNNRTSQLECGSSVVMDGTDANFLRRNFEEEYTNNITRGLEEATREELISKCLKLMEQLKDLEKQQVSRVAADFTRDSVFC